MAVNIVDRLITRMEIRGLSNVISGFNQMSRESTVMAQVNEKTNALLAAQEAERVRSASATVERITALQKAQYVAEEALATRHGHQLDLLLDPPADRFERLERVQQFEAEQMAINQEAQLLAVQEAERVQLETLNAAQIERAAVHQRTVDAMITRERELAAVQAAARTKQIELLVAMTAAIVAAGTIGLVIKTGLAMDKNDPNFDRTSSGTMTGAMEGLKGSWMAVRLILTQAFGPAVILGIKAVSVAMLGLVAVFYTISRSPIFLLLDLIAKRMGITIPNVLPKDANKEKAQTGSLLREIFGGGEIAKIGVRASQLPGLHGVAQAAVKVQITGASGQSLNRALEDIVNQTLEKLTRHGAISPAGVR